MDNGGGKRMTQRQKDQLIIKTIRIIYNGIIYALGLAGTVLFVALPGLAEYFLDYIGW